MPIVTTGAVVLRSHRYSDTSKILRLLTREHGPRSAIAKGALRPKSRFGGVLEPFAEGEVTLYLKEGRDLHTLSEFQLLRERQALGRDLARFAGASAACELVLRLAPEEPDGRLFTGLTAGLDALVESPAAHARSVALSVVWRMVRILGFAPDLRRCTACGRQVGDGEGARLDLGAGGLACGDCGGGEVGLTPGRLARFRDLVAGRPVPGEPGPIQVEILRDFIRYHLAEGLHLRSLDFLEAEVGTGR